jgi:cell division protein FtsB
MRFFTLALLVALIGLQWPLWAGKASVNANRKMEAELADQKSRNAGLLARNTALENEVKDLKSGLQSVEEYARSELGMVKRGEYFFELIDERMSTVPALAPNVSAAKK